jgi:parallel beta-helix repeat protein
MKSNQKPKALILITLGLLLAFSPILTNNQWPITEYRDINSSFDWGRNLKLSKVWGKIHIDDTNPIMNWSVAKKDGICTGNGTYSEPYVIEDLIINGGGSGDCILIENSDVYFRIENCTVYNSGIYLFSDQYWNHFAGIQLTFVDNAQILDNDCSFNNDGIHVYGFNNTISGNTANNNNNGSGIYIAGYNNTVVENTANDNDLTGIWLGCDNTTVSRNIAVNNSWFIDGIFLMGSNYNNVSGNNANIQLFESDNNNILGNNGAGIALLNSDYNTISGNTASYRIILQDSDYNIVSGNDACWEEIGDDCDGNVFSDNNGPCPSSDQQIPGYTLFFLLGILSVVTILIWKKVKNRESHYYQ